MLRTDLAAAARRIPTLKQATRLTFSSAFAATGNREGKAGQKINHPLRDVPIMVRFTTRRENIVPLGRREALGGERGILGRRYRCCERWNIKFVDIDPARHRMKFCDESAKETGVI